MKEKNIIREGIITIEFGDYYNDRQILTIKVGSSFENFIRKFRYREYYRNARTIEDVLRNLEFERNTDAYFYLKGILEGYK